MQTSTSASTEKPKSSESAPSILSSPAETKGPFHPPTPNTQSKESSYTFIDVEMPDDEVIESLSLELRKKYGVILTQIDGKLAVATCERGLEGQKDIDVLRKINLCVERIQKAVSMADDD